MDDTEVIRTYGNKSLPEGTPERPLVTFAVFAYNQEKYIREAVEGAFAQTYSPLEIILSDDCSTDRTFEIMEEMAREYEGPHRVVVREGVKNIGTIDHVIDVARISRGKYFVVAAGDDRSYPDRTATIVQAMIENGAAAAFSGYDVISDTGEMLQKDVLPEPLDEFEVIFANCSSPNRHNGRILNIPGMSAAYLTDAVASLPKTNAGCLDEDALLSFVLNLEGAKILPVHATLLAYRLSASGTSMREADSIFAIRIAERKLVRFAHSTERFYQYLEGLLASKDYRDRDEFLDNLKPRRELVRTICVFYNFPFWRRLSMIVAAILDRDGDARQLRYMLPRIFGVTVFSAAKYLYIFLSSRRERRMP